MTNLSLEQALREVERAAARVATADASTLAALRTELLGRKAGRLTQVLRSLASLSPDQRRDLGARANQLKQQLEQAGVELILGDGLAAFHGTPRASEVELASGRRVPMDL
ncbi:MAG: hypothetical protein HYT81_04720, partial [Gemmatimonadetes bacterium]|nr:hypothetical protein [Gemmatimonadota bacterium]